MSKAQRLPIYHDRINTDMHNATNASYLIYTLIAKTITLLCLNRLGTQGGGISLIACLLLALLSICLLVKYPFLNVYGSN